MYWSSTGRRRYRRASFGLVAVLVLTMAAPTLGVASQGSRTPTVEAQEVRTVWTSEFGIDRPTGMVYLAGSSEFLVVGDPSTGGAILLGNDENLTGRLVLGPIDRPSTLSYDPKSGNVTAFDPLERLEWPAGSIGTATGQRRRAGGTTDARSAAYDTSSGDLLLLSSNGREISRVGSGSSSKIRLNGVGQAELIAFNSADSLIYAMTTDHDVVAIDSTGSAVTAYDLSGLELIDPTAIVFAPTSDATDSTTNLNLFVADARGSASSGGVIEVSLEVASSAPVPVDTAILVRATATSAWIPGSPDPAGVAFLADSDTLIVVDSEVEEVTGAGWNDVNMWRTTRAGLVAQTGTFWGTNAATYNGIVGFSKEPTGASYNSASQTLFVSDDSARKIFTVKMGTDGLWGTRDDVIGAINAASYGSTDTEDPEFDAVSGHLFFLDGVGMEVFRIDPVDGVFGNGNDSKSQFDISHLGPTDFEGLASNPSRDTLFVGARTAKRIFEISKSGSVLREISVSGITGLRYISGLAYAPSSDDPSLMSLYIVDRQIDNGPDPNENDGRLWEVRAPDSLGGGGGTPENQAPIVSAGPDQTVTLPASATLAGTVTDDGLPSGAPLTILWSAVDVPSGGGVVFANTSEPSTTATFSAHGTYVLRLTAHDTLISASDDVIVNVAASPSPTTEFRALSQTSIYGTVTGALENTHVADGSTQTISEVTSSGGNRAKLEQVWTFSLTGSNRVTFVLDASRTGTEDHRFAYSVNGGSSWKTMVTVSGATHYEYVMPAGVTGTVLVRLKDLNRDKSDKVIDSIAIDRMVFVPAS